MQALTIDPTELILLATAGFFFLVQIGYYLGLYSRINRHVVACKQEKIPHTQDLPPISVIICAHNEPENLRLNLEPVLRQDYPNYEVIVINDGNDDESDDLLTRLQQQYPHLYHSYVPHSPHGTGHRKLAVTLGIKASKHEWLVFTRPDSAPQSNQWLRMLARNFTPGTQVVLGYSNYTPSRAKGRRMATLCELFSAMRYLGFALGRHPYMGIGRNLAYRKELFYKNKGFSAHLNLPLGEDDLFINRIATPTNTRVEAATESIVRITPAEQDKNWMDEKAEYAFTARYYHGAQRYLSGLETCSRLLFHAAWMATCAVGVAHHHWLAAGLGLLLFAVRLVLQALVVNRTARNLGEQGRYGLMLPAFDFAQPLLSLQWKWRARKLCKQTYIVK